MKKHLCIICVVFAYANTAFATSSCMNGYSVAHHTVDLDFNIGTPEYPTVITAANKALGTNTFILSDDGNCYDGFEPYTRTGNDVYPLIEDSDLCSEGYYRSNGSCVAFSSGGCPTGRYNSAVTSTTFVASDDGNCYDGFDVYARSGDDVYPLVNTSSGASSVVLCPTGQYLAQNGTCTAYGTGSCPQSMKDTTLNSSTWAIKVNGSCPSNYEEHTIGNIEYACDTYDNHITSDTASCTIMCGNNNVYTELNTCNSLCSGTYHKLKTNSGLEFPMYATKQITPSIAIGLPSGTACYVNTLSGHGSNAINIEYQGGVYHTVK